MGDVCVVDFNNVIADSHAAHGLADVRTDVIEIGSADDGNCPPNRNTGMIGRSLHLNRNKHGVVVEMGIHHDVQSASN